jgi:hypothetical protein
MAEMCDTLSMMEHRGANTAVQLSDKLTVQESVNEKLKVQIALLKAKNTELEKAVEYSEIYKNEAV